MTEPIRVLLIDDSAFVRQAVQRMLSEHPQIRVVGAAGSGAEGLALARTLRPDVIILDVNLPDRNGLEVLEVIMDMAPTSVLMLSTLTREGADVTMRALELGAVDFVDKASAGTTMDIHRLAPVIREKVLALAGAAPRRERIPSGEPATVPARPEPLPPSRDRGPFDLVVVALGFLAVAGLRASRTGRSKRRNGS